MKIIDKETKQAFKELCISILMLAILLISLSFAREYEQRIMELEDKVRSLENIKETMFRLNSPDYYSKLKKVEPIEMQFNKLDKLQ
jgi:hypothetical protein